MPFYSANTLIRALGSASAVTVSNGALGGAGTVNRLAKFTGATTIGDSEIFDDGGNVEVQLAGTLFQSTLVVGDIPLATWKAYDAYTSGEVGGWAFQVHGQNVNTSPGIVVVGFGAQPPNFIMGNSNGTYAAPTAIGPGKIFFNMAGAGYGGTHGVDGDYFAAVDIFGQAEETFSPTATGSSFDLQTTATGTTSLHSTLRIQGGSTGGVVMPSGVSLGWSSVATLPGSGATLETKLSRPSAGLLRLSDLSGVGGFKSALQIGGGLTGAGTETNALAFSAATAAEGTIYKAGIGLLRSNSNGRGHLTFYQNFNSGTGNFASTDAVADFDDQGRLRVYGSGATTNYMRVDWDGANGILDASSGDLVLGGTALNVRPASNGVSQLGTSNLGWKGLYLDYTNTATVGNVTINKAAGRVNIAALGTGITVTNSRVTAASHVFAIPSKNTDANAQILSVIPAAGSFTINLAGILNAQTSFDFLVINAD